MVKIRKKNVVIKIVIVLLIVLVALYYFGGAYLNDYYHADRKCLDYLENTDTVTVDYLRDDSIVFKPKEIKAGLIFYQGGKVEYTSYAPLMHKLAENGILCVLPKMPCNLAVLGINAADDIKSQFKDIDNWYIGGHSLGGAMAAKYVKDKSDEYKGLILLGAFSSGDISDTSLNTLSLIGSNDEIINFDKYEENKEKLPDDYSEKNIEGGCHSYFGCYGIQDGDGIPEITNEEQINISVDFITHFIFV